MTRYRPRRSEKKPDENKVGFGNPPKEHQFKKGKSGNPKGRPKGSKNADKLAYDILNEKVNYIDSGVSKEGSRRELALRSLAAKALKGDQRAIERLMAMDASYQAQRADNHSNSDQTNEQLLAEDEAILADLLSLGGGNDD